MILNLRGNRERGRLGTVEAGEYEDVILTRETTPLEPGVLEYKFYGPGVGVILALAVSPDFSGEQLTKVEGL